MILPSTISDVESATDEELVAAYMLDGSTREGAEAYVFALRHSPYIVD